MSAEINNREYRQRVLKELIEQLHNGKTVDEVKERFAEVFGNVSAEEIAQAEQALVAGGLPVSEIQRLCDVHASVFKGSIEDIHKPSDPSDMPGHPLHTMRRENRAVEALLRGLRADINGLPETTESLKSRFEKLSEIGRHYSRKENLLFPYLEQYGIMAPPKVMWGVDDEIREKHKELLSALEKEPASRLAPQLEELFGRVEEMIFKEENILFPMLRENLAADEWKTIADDREIEYCLIDQVPEWKPPKTERPREDSAESPVRAQGEIILPTGVLKTEELVRMLDTLPIDITFVDKDDTVKYFSQGTERVFPRTKAVIGRKVSNCHPPASVHIVEKLVEDFKTGRKDREDFWIDMKGKFVLIRYFAVRSEAGEYLGVLEVTQDIRPLREIKGEKRLVDEEKE